LRFSTKKAEKCEDKVARRALIIERPLFGGSVFPVTLITVFLATGAPPACPPAAVVVGPLGAQLTEALQRRDVRVPPPTGCAAPTVEVEATPAGVQVRRPPEPARQVPDLETAALLVETWVRAELIDPLLAARRGPPLPAVMAPPPAGRALHFGVGLDTAWADDRSLWAGVRAGGCIELGAVCPGVRLRTLFDGGWTGESAEADVWRMGLGVLATVDYAFGHARAGLGVGASAVRIDHQVTGVDDMRGAPLFEVQLAYAVPISRHWALDLSLAGDFAAWPREGRGGRRGQDDRDDQDDQDGQDDTFPGMPSWMVMAGVGARWTGQ
jgi:hypothetical protein